MQYSLNQDFLLILTESGESGKRVINIHLRTRTSQKFPTPEKNSVHVPESTCTFTCTYPCMGRLLLDFYMTQTYRGTLQTR